MKMVSNRRNAPSMLPPTVAALVAVVAGIVPTVAVGATFSVVLWGDMPYLGSSDNVFDPTDPFNFEGVSVGTLYGQWRDSINGDEAVFALHAGDIKRSDDTCIGGDSNKFWKRFEDLANSLEMPVFYTPGDNEWTDCYFERGPGIFWFSSQLPTLDYIRERFFSDASGKPVLGSNTESWDVPVTTGRSNGYPELQRFLYQDVMFVVVHVVGSNNNRWSTCWDGLFWNDYAQNCFDDGWRLFWTDFCCFGARAEYDNRNAAVNEFLRASFAAAAAADAQGVVVVAQAHIVDFEDENFPTSPPKLWGDGFGDFWNTLTDETVAFGKPVAYVHGDSHFFQYYLPDEVGAPNLQAVMVPGKASIGWVNATIDTSENATALFSFQHVDIYTAPESADEPEGDAIRLPPSSD